MDFLVPKLSATMETATVGRWLKQPGERVKLGEAVIEIETDKATMEVEAPADGTLAEILAEAGDVLPIGGVLGRIETGSGASAAPAAKAAAPPVKAAPPAVSSAPAAALPLAAPTKPAAALPPRLLASPLAKRLAGLHAVDLAQLKGSGPNGRVRKRDVLAAVPAAPERPAMQPVSAAAATALPVGAEKLSAMRAQIAQSVTRSRQTIPSFVLDLWVDIGAVERARQVFGQEAAQANGVKLTVTDFLLQALADSLGAAPGMLDRWHDDGPSRIRGGSVDIGLVVAVTDGVMIPVLRDLGGKTLGSIARLRQDAVQRARAGRLTAIDSTPVAISLSNIGKGGADRFEAIISPGQTSILAVGRSHERVVAKAGAIAIGTGVNLTLSVDHRLIDGRVGAEFLGMLAERIELGPWGLG